jgi:hypothetical protein
MAEHRHMSGVTSAQQFQAGDIVDKIVGGSEEHLW